MPHPDWTPPSDWLRIETIDLHTAGEPLRVIVSGFPDPEGKTILECRRAVKARYDDLRKALMWEPRGHREMYGCLLLPPERPSSDFGVLFLHNEGYSTMCGHAVIALGRFAVETGMVPRTDPVTTVRIDTPAGPVQAFVHSPEGTVTDIAFHNVPSYAEALDATVRVEGIGTVRYDLAFGGAYYAYVDVADVGLTGDAAEYQTLIETGMAIKRAVMRDRRLRHPERDALNFLYGTIFVAPPRGAGVHSRHVCVFADGQVDRSPTGTGVSGRLALLHARGCLAEGETVVIESLIDTRFSGRLAGTVTYGSYEAVIPEVQGQAYFTGKSTFYLDPVDPLRHGFFLG